MLIVSLFGPRHGRLVQAKFNKSGVLKVRASPIYSFVRKDEAPWNLFLRYHACEPRDGPNIEFGDDEEESVSPQAPEYVSPVTRSSKATDAPAQGPKHTPNLPEFEKENAPPQEDETTSADDL